MICQMATVPKPVHDDLYEVRFFSWSLKIISCSTCFFSWSYFLSSTLQNKSSLCARTCRRTTLLGCWRATRSWCQRWTPSATDFSTALRFWSRLPWDWGPLNVKNPLMVAKLLLGLFKDEFRWCSSGLVTMWTWTTCYGWEQRNNLPTLSFIFSYRKSARWNLFYCPLRWNGCSLQSSSPLWFSPWSYSPSSMFPPSPSTSIRHTGRGW